MGRRVWCGVSRCQRAEATRRGADPHGTSDLAEESDKSNWRRLQAGLKRHVTEMASLRNESSRTPCCVIDKDHVGRLRIWGFSSSGHRLDRLCGSSQVRSVKETGGVAVGSVGGLWQTGNTGLVFHRQLSLGSSHPGDGTVGPLVSDPRSFQRKVETEF